MKVFVRWLAAGIVLAALIFAGLPRIAAAQGGCPGSSGNSYAAGGAYQHDLDNPVRQAWMHADKNLQALRGYEPTSKSAPNLVVYGGAVDPIQPPQLATLFSPSRVPVFSTHRAFAWRWQPSPNPGWRAAWVISAYPVTALGMATTPGEALVSPVHGRNIGDPWGHGGAMLIFADDDSVALHFTREDSAAPGYTVHIDNICPDPNLLALYRSLDNADRMSTGEGSGNFPQDGILDYDLPGLHMGQVFGTARGSEIHVAIVDSGRYMDPRSKYDWWQIRPIVPPPDLISPEYGANVDNPVTLSWNPVESAANYELMIDDSPGFYSPAVYTIVTEASFSAPNLTPGKLFYWRVRANSINDGSVWSGVRAFKVNPPPPPSAPSLISPDDAAQVVTPATVQWDPVPGAATYRVQIDNDSDFSSPLISWNVSAASYTTSILTTGVTVYWRVQARNTSGSSEWSVVRSFTVVAPPALISPD